MLSVNEEDEIIVITSQGNTIRLRVRGIRPYGRHATGVRIVDIAQPDFVVGIDRADTEDEGEGAAAGLGEMPEVSMDGYHENGETETEEPADDQDPEEDEGNE